MLTVGTHDGIFHADEVFAIATLRMLCKPKSFTLIRSRDPEVLAPADILVDVGFSNDPEMGFYDHHQPEGGGTRDETGIPYASFGLVWSRHGIDACSGNPIVADMVDREMVSVIDAADCGFNVCEGLTFQVTAIISGLNPTWCEENRDRDTAFWDAVDMAEGILKRKIASCMSREAATSQVRKAIVESDDGPIVVLGRYCPWQETVCREAPNALYVLFQDVGGGWRVQCVPPQLGDFGQRRPLPASWAGLPPNELAEETDVLDATFCHIGRFICGAESKEGAVKLAELALLSD